MSLETMVEEVTNTMSPSISENVIPNGDYKLVGWDLDTTGKKPTDEICQIAGYTQNTQYSQYVMPFKNLSRSAKMRYALKVITIRKFRMLKDTKANKVVKTKSEVSALMEFIQWLKDINGDSDGIILVFHEHRQIIPAILLENLKKYEGLYDQFSEIVKGFVNSCDVAKANGKGTNNSFSMRTLARNFFNKTIEEYELCNAAVRANLALEIMEHFICMSDDTQSESKNIAKMESSKIFDYIRNYVQTIQEEESIGAELKAVIQREINLTPIFSAFFISKKERQQATLLRRMLAEAEVEFAQVEEAWKTEKKNGLEKIFDEKMKNASPKEVQKLLIILDCFFDEKDVDKELLKLEQEKKPSIRKKRRAAKKVDTTNNTDSGNDSGDNTLTQSPTKIEVTDSNENKIEVAAL